MIDRPDSDSDKPRGAESFIVVIVGPCASGKSTLAANLRAIGIDARVSGQEHSEVRWLWRRMEPSLVIGLHIDLQTLRLRRGATWSERIFDAQQRRLQDAYDSAHLHLDTALLDEDEAMARALAVIRKAGGESGEV